MSHSPDFSPLHLDIRDEFVDLLITVVMVALAIDGWLRFGW
jgi:hypothetical protein